MKITVINGTEKHGITYKLKEMFLQQFNGKADVEEFYLPKDCPGFCAGCTQCFLKDQHLCKDAEYVQKIERSMLDADLLLFTSPAYVMHTTGAMKAMLDHFGYRWMPHRPAKEMFGKRAVIITQCLGAGDKSAAKDIKDSLSWWGVSYIKKCKFKLMSDIVWDRLAEKKKNEITKKITSTGRKFADIDYGKPAHVNLMTKAKFYMVRMLQTDLGKKDPEYTDYKYWKSNGWLDKVRPWKES
ncbi:MAG: NAD(P)H-dependent oxidoreductase [Saccharofermentans sp.]|nr:NAD(P)H-dependent oxidoreductase [Saccharofermentans sp.]